MLSNIVNIANVELDVNVDVVEEEVAVEVEVEESESYPDVIYSLQDDSVSETMSEQYGCYMIDISKLSIRNDIDNFQSTILTTDNVCIDTSTVSEILISCILQDR